MMKLHIQGIRLILAIATVASLTLPASADQTQELPTLENLEIFHLKVGRHAFRPQLEFVACAETKAEDWIVQTELKEVQLGETTVTYATISLNTKQPLVCDNEFKTANTYPGVHIPLEGTGLEKALKIFVKNRSEVSVAWDE